MGMTTKGQAKKESAPRAPAEWYVEVYRSKRPVGRQKFRLRIVAVNSKRLMQGEAYTNREDALHAAHLIADPAGAEVKDST